jgi:cysteine desulfurase family protein (TIGR01976 family)
MFDSESCARCRLDFPSLERRVDGRPIAFLDGPAGTQVPRQAIDAIRRYYENWNANTGGAFSTSIESDRMLHESREAAAAFLGAPGWSGISFGQNMTTLAFSLSRAFAREFSPGDEVVVTELDHEANRAPWLNLAEGGIAVREVALMRDGRLDYGDLERKITHRTRLFCVGMSSNCLGTVNDIARIRELTREAGAWLLLDAVHYAAHFPVDVAALDADFLLCSGYKFYGPHVGILYSRPGLLGRLRTDRLRTQQAAAPYRIETGTLNHAAIAGLKAAIEYIASWGDGADLRARIVSAMNGIAAYEHGLARRYYDGLGCIPGATVWGPDFSCPRRAPTVSITLEGLRPDEAARALGRRGLQVWSGHFYAIRCIEALGLAESGGVVRTGVSMYNTMEEIDRLLEAVADEAKRVR